MNEILLTVYPCNFVLLSFSIKTQKSIEQEILQKQIDVATEDSQIEQKSQLQHGKTL